jgi:queuine tRNA-ribosyltransferase
MLTDSGGFQVFSLGERSMSGTAKTAMRRVSEEGVTFSSHIDGRKELLTPEASIAIQQKLGADIIMAFDQPVYGLSESADAKLAMERSLRWLERSKQQWQSGDQNKQALFGIVQGGIHHELHTKSAIETVKQDLPGYAIGGLSVGESKEQMWEAVASVVQYLPEDKPRYFMGLGDPYDCMHAVRHGIDMFDCVSPTRIARHGAYWEIQADPEVVEAFWRGDAEALVRYRKPFRFTRERIGATANRRATGKLSSGVSELSLGMLCHYHHSGEALGWRVLSLHNIALLHAVTKLAGEVEFSSDIMCLLTS